MRSFYNFGVLEALPPPARAVLCPPPGDGNPPPVSPACKLWTACPAACLRLFKISFCANPDTVPATDQNNRPRRGGSMRPLCGSVRRLSGLPCLDIPRSLRGLCRGCAAAWRGGKRAKEKPPTAGRLWPYLFIFKSSARTTTGKAMIQRATSIFSPPQTNVNRFAVVVLVNLSAMAGAFFFNAVVSIRELVTVL